MYESGTMRAAILAEGKIETKVKREMYHLPVLENSKQKFTGINRT